MMMVRSSEHTTLQHTTLTSWGTSRGLCAHYGCRPAISRPMAPPQCPTACWRWGVQLGQGGGGALPLAVRVSGKGASAPALYEGIEPVSIGRENGNHLNTICQIRENGDRQPSVECFDGLTRILGARGRHQLCY